MSKHPTPWTIDQSGGYRGYIVDANEVDVARVDTPDPEARVVLLHAAEMWEAIQGVASVGTDTPAYRHADKAICLLVDKIKYEIAKGKP